MNSYSWLRIWAQAGVLILQILRVPIVSTLSLSTALHQGHTVSLKSHQLLGNRPFLFHYNPWQMLGWSRVYGKAIKLERLSNIRNALYNKESVLASKNPSKISRKRQKENSIVRNWLPAASVRSGLQYALHPDVLDSVVSFDPKSRFTPGMTETNGQKGSAQKSERIEQQGKQETHARGSSPSMHKLHVQTNIQTHDAKLTQANQKENPALRNSARPNPNAFGGFDGFQSFDMVPVVNKEPGLGDLFDMEGPPYFSGKEEKHPDQDGDVWMTAGSGQLKGSFGTVQSYEGHFVDEAVRESGVIVMLYCQCHSWI